MRALVVALLASIAATGCTSTSQIGPYVKSVARNGAALAVERCMIVLVGDTLEEGTCHVDHVPLGSVPAVPAYPATPAYPAAPAPSAAVPPPQASQ